MKVVINMRKYMTLDDLPDILQVEDVMEFLHIGRNTMYQLLKTGEFPSIKIGRQYRIPKQYLLSYLDHGCYNSVMEGSPDREKGDVSR